MDDLLETDYVDEVKRRRETILPMLRKIATDEKNYRMKSGRGWGIIHAVYLLGILGDPGSIDALLAASEFSNKHDIDWLWDALPECYLRIGPAAIPALKSSIEKDKTNDEMSVITEITGLWNIWSAYPDTKKDIEDFFLKVIKSPGENFELRTNLIADFAEMKRPDLRPIFESYYEMGEIDLNTLPKEDFDYFYDEAESPIIPGFRYDLEAFYSHGEVAKRQERWKKEDEQAELNEVEDLILENFSKIGRNESCPCGSGIKFKKCHLTWAEKELEKIRIEKIRDEEDAQVGQSIFDERHYETILRRFLASKQKASIFNLIKEKTIEAIKLPPGDLHGKGLINHLGPILNLIEFQDQGEFQEFLNNYREYHNAIAKQYVGHPRDEKRLH
ncbi:MAG: SEC-C domain-containing protein [Deltaproteobacteria bacterium]|nr:SEC-C domain-containing protein [Deltaproteobacteria bacterium]